ncbi:MAG: DNA helicase RecQ [Bacteroidales bacterium]|nr:DNA helicase RecQ [Bacteroidales bacterium]MBD5205904.1 DNA helicase RecQ [Bacteroidales bacterium]MBD5302038.1 DNA helicase RecQ [Bacteroides sp.]
MADSYQIRKALKTHFGFDSFKGNQFEIINSLLDGNDVFVLMPTGGGKSLCYQLPALMSEGTAVIISPLIALMKNQVDAIRNFEEKDNVAHFLNSSLSKSAIETVKKDVKEGRTKLLYVAPESLAKGENVEFLKSIKISFFAVDEAHCISEWGHDFRPEYRKIRPMISSIGNFRIIALTATATPKVQHDIQKNLGILDAKVFKSSFNRKNLYYEVRPKTADVDKDIIRYAKNNCGKSGIIYCLSRKKVEELAETLRINGIKALPYHAGMDVATRSKNQDAFIREDIDVIVATIAFGMGIDKPDVRYVLHYDIPKSLEGYYQETGRAGRDGGEGRCITFYSRKDLQKLEKLIQSKSVQEQEISRQLLSETADYAESSVCRRKILLRYFGENYNEANCGNCDNCLNPRQQMEATEAALSVIQVVLNVGQRYRFDYIVNILIGRPTDEIRSNHHDKIEGFGAVADMEEKLVGMLVRQVIIAGYLTKDLDNYGVLKVTDEGIKFLENPTSFTLVQDVDYADTAIETRARGVGAGALDPTLFNILKGLRKDIARKKGIAPYLVFLDPTIEAMSTLYPINKEELLTVPGVGSGKALKYGKEFTDVIARYVEENEIERPADVRIKLIAKKCNPKVSIIQSVDRRIDLEEVCESLGMEFSDFISELETIVEAGTKIDIDYYIEEYFEEEQIEELYDFFRTSEDGDIESAIQALGAYYDDDDIRLLRVSFISKFGN